MKRAFLSSIIVSAALAAGLIGSSVVAKGPGGGPGGGPPVTGEEAANNLSVPAIFVPSTTGAPPLGFACGDAVLPTGTTTYFAAPYDNPEVVGDGVPGDYYVQGEDKWQASCATNAGGLLVNSDWGDNLVSAPLKAGTPIRVEVGLLANDPTTLGMTGFMVYKLTDELDRLATYGTLGNASTPYGEVRVWTSGVTLKIEREDGFVVYDGPFTAEVNSTGRIVYGYNWKKPLAGDYTITVTTPGVTITSVDAGTLVDSGTISIAVDVAARAGGGKPVK